MNRLITVVTGSRAEFGLLKALLGLIKDSSDFDLDIVVTGSHFSDIHGFTVSEIRDAGFSIFYEMKLDLGIILDEGIGKVVGEVTSKFSDYLSTRNPSLVIVLGDRYEIFGVASACVAQGFPVGHIHGGEITEGSKDDIFRHAITKMSSIHFVANEEFRRRVIQLGEVPDKVHEVGGLGVDAINQVQLMTKHEVEKILNFSIKNNFAVVTFHPDTLKPTETKTQVDTLIRAMAAVPELQFIVTSSNAHSHGMEVNTLFQKAETVYPNLVFVKSLGQTIYLSLLKLGKVVVGNSSSGILEAPSLGIATVNIGARQNGRPRANSVIDVECVDNEIRDAILLSLSQEFQLTLTSVDNPYGAPGASKKIMEILKLTNYESLLPKKFYDSEFGAL